MDKKVDLIDVLFDDFNDDPILLTDESGKDILFERVSVFHYYDVESKTDDMYCLLSPLTPIVGIDENMAIVFKIVASETEAHLEVEKDEAKTKLVYLYYCEEVLGKLFDDKSISPATLFLKGLEMFGSLFPSNNEVEDDGEDEIDEFLKGYKERHNIG